MAKKVKPPKADAIRTATDTYNAARDAYTKCCVEYSAIKLRLSQLRLERDAARIAMQTVHDQKGVTIHE
jgi:hypothetical protein